jgi:pimeloyl-ACP methyl ester carboxylesterase
MHREEPTLTVDDLGGYPGPPLVVVGDRDEEIPMEHTLALREGLPDAQLAVLPGAGHGGLDARIVIEFLAGREEKLRSLGVGDLEGGPGPCIRLWHSADRG